MSVQDHRKRLSLQMLFKQIDDPNLSVVFTNNYNKPSKFVEILFFFGKYLFWNMLMRVATITSAKHTPVAIVAFSHKYRTIILQCERRKASSLFFINALKNSC